MAIFSKVSDAAIQLLSNLARESDFHPSYNSLVCFEHVGIGASFALSFEHGNILLPETWCVVSVPPHSTAFEAGLRPSDVVLEVYTTDIMVTVLKVKNCRTDQWNSVHRV